MIKIDIKKGLIIVAVFSFTNLNAFNIRPGIVTLAPGGTKKITIDSDNAKEYMTYRLDVEGGESGDLTFKDSRGESITSINLDKDPVSITIQAPNKEGDYVLAFDSRPADQLYTGQMVFARQGVSVTVKKPTTPG